MRKQLCEALVARSKNQKMIFLTGDLGYMALEPLLLAMESRFINAGVAEQNMVSVAAAMAREGLEPWVYSIAPFCYARAFEQIRNDITFHHLPVKIIGNGGGYGYGVMGPTHHAIEDYGILLTLPHMRVFIPGFDEDVKTVIERASTSPHPVYIRLGLGEMPSGLKVPDYLPWRQLTKGGGLPVIVSGPIAGTYIESFNKLAEEIRPNLWIITELPVETNPMPEELIQQISTAHGVAVIEEHVKRGGLGSELALILLEKKIEIKRFHHFHARSHDYGRYGSQEFLRKKSGLDPINVLQILTSPNEENYFDVT